MDLIDKTMQQIEAQEVTPIPKWHFLVRSYGLWLLSALLLVLGAFAASVTIYLIEHNDWDLYSRVHKNVFIFVIETLPYLWIVIVGVVALLVYVDIRHTQRGYRQQSVHLILGTLLLSVFLGGLLHNLGFSQRIDDHITQKGPSYLHVLNPRINNLSKPEKGLLMGRIVTVSSTRNFTIENPKVGYWVVTIQNTATPTEGLIHQEAFVRLVGDADVDKTFAAELVLPFHAPGPIEGLRNHHPEEKKVLTY